MITKNNKTPFLLEGDLHTDHRGSLSFTNEFSLKKIKRFYIIEHSNREAVRAWQGHKLMPKYFQVISGSFWIACVKIDDWLRPSKKLKVTLFQLDCSKPAVLCVPPGFANGIKAIKEGSKLISFCEDELDEYPEDEFRYDSNMWLNWTDLK